MAYIGWFTIFGCEPIGGGKGLISFISKVNINMVGNMSMNQYCKWYILKFYKLEASIVAK